MQKVLKQAISVALAVGILAGCASEEDTIQMAPLPVVENTFTPVQGWSSKVGDGVGHFFSKLTPAVGYGKVFVADRNGLVKALDPDTGSEIWQQDLEGDISARLAGGISLSYGKVFIGSENAR